MNEWAGVVLEIGDREDVTVKLNDEVIWQGRLPGSDRPDIRSAFVTKLLSRKR